MRCRHLAIVLLLTLFSLLAISQPIQDEKPDPFKQVDHAGRQIALPSSVQKVYTTTEAGLFLLYAIDPEAIVGWNRGLNPNLEFAVQPQYHHLPTLGTWNNEYQTIQIDLVRDLKPDLILHYAPADSENMVLAQEIEDTIGIPTVLLDNSLSALPDCLRTLGSLLGKEIRGNTLATFAENSLQNAVDFQCLHTSYNPIPVHIVSEFSPGHFDELLNLAGMIELSDWTDEPPFPDFVLIMPHSVADPYWEAKKAGYKRLYQIPAFPLNWLDPTSVFGLLGLEWLLSIAYQTTYPVDLAESYQAFMEIFFQINITPSMLRWTLERSGVSYQTN